jgi:CBS domain-containing protein
MPTLTSQVDFLRFLIKVTSYRHVRTIDAGVCGEYDRRIRFTTEGEWPLNRGASVNKISGTVGTILKRKGGEIWSVRPEQTVYEANEMMADKGVGALLVMSDGKLAGIISERDYARKVILQGRSSRTTVIREIMTSQVISVGLKEAVDECMELMTRNRIRHLPIMENERVIGIVSIGDLVKWLVSEQEETIEHLHNYISAKYPS